MKQHYDSPEMEIEKFTSYDVITTSGGIEEGGDVTGDEVFDPTNYTNFFVDFS